MPQNLLCTLHPLTQPAHQPFLVGFSHAHLRDEAPETQTDQDLVAQLVKGRGRVEVETRTPALPPSLASWKLLLGFEEWKILWQEGKDPSVPGRTERVSLFSPAAFQLLSSSESSIIHCDLSVSFITAPKPNIIPLD